MRADRAAAAASPALSQPDLAPLATKLRHVPVALSCGGNDALNVVTRDLLTRLRRRHGAEVTGGIVAGYCHDAVFRRRMLARQLPFLARHLT